MFSYYTLAFSSIVCLFLITDYNFFWKDEVQGMESVSPASPVTDGGGGFMDGDLSILPLMIIKVLFVVFVLQLLSRIKFYTKRTRLDDLLDKTKISLKKTHDVLDKWKNSDHLYSDDEADESRPMYLEVPVLHIAIFDSSSRKDLVSEAGDSNSVYVT